ncbi:hypothetical protein F5883DRAFT_589295 [Diaporthe sp. PMI_573]|nr:hypothetical protein F5883DRAFT_589295 [Diaporthaceae sp. PMI_573]
MYILHQSTLTTVSTVFFFTSSSGYSDNRLCKNTNFTFLVNCIVIDKKMAAGMFSGISILDSHSSRRPTFLLSHPSSCLFSSPFLPIP